MKRKTSWRCRGGVALFLRGIARCCATALGETPLVKDGQPRAEIVILDRPARMVKLAADELQGRCSSLPARPTCDIIRQFHRLEHAAKESDEP